MMRSLSIDLETYSEIDLTKCGVYAYAASPSFEILLIAYAYDDAEVQLIDLANGEQIPEEVIKDLLDENIIKTAYNAQFERTCLSKHLNKQLSPVSWQCTAVQSAMLGLPLSLEGVGQVLGLQQQKLKEGKDLIRYFSVPCKATKANGGRTRNLPVYAPEKWEQFKSYCIRDVEVERAIRAKLAKFPISKKEQNLYILDQQINDRGVLVDMELVTQAICCDELYKSDIYIEAQELTGLDNPNSVAQLKEWLIEQGVEVDSLSKKAVAELAKESDGEVERLLNLRLQLAKTSIKKYEAIERSVCPDGRVRGLLQFYGANRTGRWAGRIINSQNLPQNHLPDLTLARNLIKAGCYDDLEMLYEIVPNLLSELIRTAFIPKAGSRFIVADFSAIEARVIAWLAGEKWRMDVFASHGKIYEASASQMFKVPMEEITKGSPLRQKGKVAELACIAEGELVLTDRGLVPIENVKLHHKLWNGQSWVSHEGVVYRGKKEVIEYEGLRATKDHLVWVEGQAEPIQFESAAASGAHLIQTGNGGQTIRLGENHQPRKKVEQRLEPLLCANTMCRLSKHSMDNIRQPYKGKIKRMPSVLPTKKNTLLAGQTTYCSQTKMRESKRSQLPQIRWARNLLQISFCHGGRSLDSGKCRKCLKRIRTGSNRHEQALRTRQYKICTQKRKSKQQNINGVIRVESGRMAICKNCCNQNAFIRDDQRRYYCKCTISGKRKKKELEADTSKIRVYDIRNVGKHNRFTVSGKLVHNCGYGGGAGALKAMGALDMGVEEHELRRLIDNWRAANPNITNFWWKIDRAAQKAVKEKSHQVVGKIKLESKSGILFITLPSGRKLSYIKPRIELNKFNREGITYEGIGENKRWCRIETYGPKLVENCLAGDTLILTDQGWKEIRNVELDDLLWDGDGWVQHDGVKAKGMQSTIDLNGVRMTEEHLVLTESGWIHASSCEGYNWAKVKLPDGCKIHRFKRQEVFVGRAVRLWQRNSNDSIKIYRRKTKVMRLHKEGSNRVFKYGAWNVKTSRVCCLAVNDRPMPFAIASGMEQLWGTRNKSLRKMAGKFFKFLVRHAGGIRARAVHRKNRCERELHTGELPVGHGKRAESKQTEKSFCGFAARVDDCSRVGRMHWDRSDNVVISNKTQLPKRAFVRSAGRYEPVYDIMNSGKNQSFTVLGNSGTFIVHNCVQATARDILAEAMVAVDKAGYKIVMHVHDEIIVEAPVGTGSVDEVCEIMCRPLPWADGLLLRADGYECDYYKKD